MQATALVAVRRRLDEPWARAAVVVGAAVVSGVCYLWMRLATAQTFPRVRSFKGYCQRVQPPDVYPCHVATGPMVRAYLFASLLVWLGLPGACVILMLAGRGPLAFVPLAALGIGHGAAGWLFRDQLSVLPLLGVYADPFFSGGLGAGYWATHGMWASIADLAVLAAPAAGVAWVVKPERETTRWRGRPALAWSSAVCVGSAVVLLWFANGQITWGSLGFSASVPIWAPGVVMIAFGLLLPARANWWPWAIGPVAGRPAVGGPVGAASVRCGRAAHDALVRIDAVAGGGRAGRVRRGAGRSPVGTVAPAVRSARTSRATRDRTAAHPAVRRAERDRGRAGAGLDGGRERRPAAGAALGPVPDLRGAP